MTTAVTERYEFSINSTENLTSFFNATASSLFPQDDGEFEDIEAIKGKVSVSVFISFTFIFLVGLIGNILVVTGENLQSLALHWDQHIKSIFHSMLYNNRKQS